MDSIRGTALLQFGELLAEYGRSQRDFLRPLRIDLDVVGSYEKTLPYKNLVQLFEGSAHALSLPQFGLELGKRQGSTLMGPLRHLATSAPTIGQALVAVIRYMRNYSPSIHYRLEHRPGQALLYFHNALPGSEETPQIVEKSVLAARLLVGELRGTVFRPRAVTFRHAPLGEPDGYQRYFDCPVMFQQEHNCLFLPPEILREPCIRHDAVLHSIVRFYLETHDSQADDLCAQVERRIQTMLPSHRCTLEQVAQALDLHPRTLQRRLARDGVDFEAHLDRIRRRQAEHMLRTTSLSVGQIASELGYRRTTSFCRAHQRWFDMTPSEHRKEYGDPPIARLVGDEKAPED
ncbi:MULTISPECIES: AraC family transcriptional regulator [Pseudomonas]|uniref:AraC family transcriptional regulator n=1 Tax=Pseudomonas guariconensis TaxID=1288410 RepID=UPI0020972ABF|nr:MULTISPECIES: AraC family transcriptional regulator [Pseudomonas]MCO7593814.1 AraC family transcriptional regulator [Pseudomonas guariconensis]MCU7219579.1 AraC family transcriptional regulator [Pseudomonas brassicacearum]